MVGNLDKARMRLVCKAVSVKLWKRVPRDVRRAVAKSFATTGWGSDRSRIAGKPDASLGWRLVRGERVYEAHRCHAYQWLARRWGSHSKVTCAVLMVNVLWLLPCAVFATRRPSLAAATVIFAFAPLVLVAIATSGRREAND